MCHSMMGLTRCYKTAVFFTFYNNKKLYFATPFAFNVPDGQIPWDDLRKILHEGQRIARVHSGEEILLKGSTLRVGCTNVTDDRRICDSKDPNVT